MNMMPQVPYLCSRLVTACILADLTTALQRTAMRLRPAHQSVGTSESRAKFTLPHSLNRQEKTKEPLTENVNVATLTKSYTVGEAMNPVVVITVKQVQKMPSNDLQLREMQVHMSVLPEIFGKGPNLIRAQSPELAMGC